MFYSCIHSCLCLTCCLCLRIEGETVEFWFTYPPFILHLTSFVLVFAFYSIVASQLFVKKHYPELSAFQMFVHTTPFCLTWCAYLQSTHVCVCVEAPGGTCCCFC